MKKFKNNKGITGIDIVVSVTLIVITLGIVMAVYTSYANKTKEVKRNSTATNLAMKVIESIETKEISDIEIETGTTDEIDISSGYGVDSIPNGYTISAKKIDHSNDILQNIAFQVDVTVSYNVGKEQKKVTLSTIKKYDEVGEAEAPDMDSMPAGCIPVKYDSAKGGYVETDDKDLEWYSISSKLFPIVVNTGSNDFDRNGVIQLEDCSEIYVWIPSYIYDSLSKYYRYVMPENGTKFYYINYGNMEVTPTVGETAQMYYYKKGSEVDVSITVKGGWWQRVNANLEPINETGQVITDAGNNYNEVKNNIFTW